MLFLFFAGCAYTVQTLAQVSPGGGAGEFYAIVRTDYYSDVQRLESSDATLIRCLDTETDATAETTCSPVLTSDDAFRVVRANKAVTFPRRVTAATGSAVSSETERILAAARALYAARQGLIRKEALTADQAATVSAQALKEACAMIATVTDRPCQAVLGIPAP